MIVRLELTNQEAGSVYAVLSALRDTGLLDTEATNLHASVIAKLKSAQEKAVIELVGTLEAETHGTN
jgi:hypothetical protein